MVQKLPTKVLQAVSTLPPLPSSVTKLINLTSDLTTDTREITRVISSDEVLNSKILRMVNSASFGLSHRVQSITQATMILGFDRIKELAISFSMLDFLNQRVESLNISRNDFWRHSIAVACLGRMLGRSMGLNQSEELFTVGLLHDIGKVVFMTYFTEKYRVVLESLRPKRKLITMAEKEVLGFDHALLGMEVCNYWNLPPSLAKVVEDHHKVPNRLALNDEVSKTSAAVYFADNMAKVLGVGESGEIFLHTNFVKVLGEGIIMPPQLCDAAARLVGEVRNYEGLFNIPPMADPRVAQDGEKILLRFRDKGFEQLVGITMVGFGFEVLPNWDGSSVPTGTKAVVFDTLDDPVMANLKASHPDVRHIDFKVWTGSEAGKSALLPLDIFRRWLKATLGYK